MAPWQKGLGKENSMTAMSIPARRRKKLVLTGARSVFDLTGARSYRAMRQQLPETQPRTPDLLLRDSASTLTRAKIEEPQRKKQLSK
jgi:hypothetical protein